MLLGEKNQAIGIGCCDLIKPALEAKLRLIKSILNE